MKLSLLSRFIRLPNLVIAALTMVLVYYTLIYPELEIKPAKPLFILLIEVLTVTVIMTAGNIYNDYCDQITDQLNKRKNLFAGSLISSSTVLWWYKKLNILATLFSIILLIATNNWILIFIHLLAIALLFVYSNSAKGKPFIGNLIVAFLSAMIIPIVPILYWNRLPDSFWSIDHQNLRILILFTLFSFLTTLWRELVKDLQDREGDRIAGHKTLAILWSREKNKLLGSVFIIALLVLLVFLSITFFRQNHTIPFYYLLGLIISLIYLFVIFLKAESPRQDHQLSTFLKVYMLQGLLLLLLFKL